MKPKRKGVENVTTRGSVDLKIIGVNQLQSCTSGKETQNNRSKLKTPFRFRFNLKEHLFHSRHFNFLDRKCVKTLMNPTLLYFSQCPDALRDRGLLLTGHSGGEEEQRLMKTTRQDGNHGGSVTWNGCQT